MKPNEIVRAPVVHELKCWPEYYEAVERGDKPFEVRKWDRPYSVGDTLLLREFDPEKLDYTRRQTFRKITYLLDLTYLPGDNTPRFAGYVVLGMEDTRLCDCIERLQAELEESQRRERAAVKEIHEIDRFNGKCLRCKSWNGVRCKRGYSVNASFCNDWEWRGQEKEGDANEHDA